jgi:hypothetical protein
MCEHNRLVLHGNRRDGAVESGAEGTERGNEMRATLIVTLVILAIGCRVDTPVVRASMDEDGDVFSRGEVCMTTLDQDGDIIERTTFTQEEWDRLNKSDCPTNKLHVEGEITGSIVVTNLPPEWLYVDHEPAISFTDVNDDVRVMEITNRPYILIGNSAILLITDDEWATLTNAYPDRMVTNTVTFYK